MLQKLNEWNECLISGMSEEQADRVLALMGAFAFDLGEALGAAPIGIFGGQWTSFAERLRERSLMLERLRFESVVGGWDDVSSVRLIRTGEFNVVGILVLLQPEPLTYALVGRTWSHTFSFADVTEVHEVDGEKVIII